ncbi:MAG: hypothetical protein QXW98_06575 [Candidatus Caldarchaeum sp.]
MPNNENVISNVILGADTRTIETPYLIVPSIAYRQNFPPQEEILTRFNQQADIIFAPFRDPDKNMLLLKRIRLFVEGNKQVRIRIYTKGKKPKDNNTDLPDWDSVVEIKNGENIINVPHLLSEVFIFRFTWDLEMQTRNVVLFGGTNKQMVLTDVVPFNILRFLIDVERYGEKGVVVGNED